MIGYTLIVEVADPGNKRMVTVRPRPQDRLRLRGVCTEDMVGVILNNIVGDWVTLWPTFRPRLYVYVCHYALLFGSVTCGRPMVGRAWVKPPQSVHHGKHRDVELICAGSP